MIGLKSDYSLQPIMEKVQAGCFDQLRARIYVQAPESKTVPCYITWNHNWRHSHGKWSQNLTVSTDWSLCLIAQL